MSRTPRSEQELQTIRDGILDSAMVLFMHKGVDGVSMAELAREAGYSTASLYNYFLSKDDLVRALLLRGLERCLAVVEQPLPLGLAPEARLEFILLGLLGTIREQFWLMSALVLREGEPMPEAQGDTRHFRDVYEGLFLALRDEIGRLEWLRPDLVPALTHHFMGMVRTEAVIWLHQDAPDDLTALAHQLMVFWLAGARAVAASGPCPEPL